MCRLQFDVDPWTLAIFNFHTQLQHKSVSCTRGSPRLLIHYSKSPNSISINQSLFELENSVNVNCMGTFPLWCVRQCATARKEHNRQAHPHTSSSKHQAQSLCQLQSHISVVMCQATRSNTTPWTHRSPLDMAARNPTLSQLSPGESSSNIRQNRLNSGNLQHHESLFSMGTFPL